MSVSIQSRKLYESSKDKYYANIVDSGYNKPSDFYRFVNSVRKPKCGLPTIMYVSDVSYTGPLLDQRLSQSLFSNFSTITPVFSTDDDDAYVQLLHIHN